MQTALIHATKFPRPLSQATSYIQPNVFTFAVVLPEERGGGTWEPPQQTMFFLPPRSKMSIFSQNVSLLKPCSLVEI